MKYLIVGLGNKGSEYYNTRHNIGFRVADELVESAETEWETAKLAQKAEVKHKGRTLVVIKPNTYMNLSGKAVHYWLQQEKIPPARLLVIVDDLNLDFGVLRFRGKGTHGGHNGLKDIQQQIGSSYARLRVGIGSDFGRGQQVDYVLGKWTAEEKTELPAIITRSAEAVRSFSFAGLQQSMNSYNG